MEKRKAASQIPNFQPSQQHFGRSLEKKNPFEGYPLSELVAIARSLDPTNKLDSINYADLLEYLCVLCNKENKGNRCDPLRSELMDLGLCKVLLNVVRTSLEKDKVVTEKIVSLACDCISFLSRNDNVLETLMHDAELGAIKLLVHLLEVKLASLQIAVTCSGAIRSLTRDLGSNVLKALKGTELLTKAMKIHSADELLCENCILIIYEICPTRSYGMFDYGGNTHKLDQLGTMSLIEEAIGRFYDNTTISYFGGMLIREWQQMPTITRSRRCTASTIVPHPTSSAVAIYKTY